MKLPRIFYSKLFLTGVLILLLGVFILQLQQWQERRSIDKEIAELVSQKQALEQKNQDLAQSLQYFASDSYKEKLAREQLGLKKEGELVINFPANLNLNNSAISEKQLSNPQKWWHYFFLRNTN